MTAVTRVLATALVLMATFVSLHGQTTVELLSPTDTIPRGTFSTWSLFLICDPAWASSARSADLGNLYHRFQAFGTAIGPGNAAVWFWKRQTTISDPDLGANVDVDRSAAYCSALHLDPVNGPFLVMTPAYPDAGAFPTDRLVLQLGGLDSAAIAAALNGLAAQLPPENPVARPGGANTALAAPVNGGAAAGAGGSAPANGIGTLWIRLLESAQKTIITLGCAVKLQLTAGPLTAEVKGCPGGVWP